MLDSLSELFTSGLSAVLSFFPTSPFTILDDMASNEFGEWLAFLNWFIPISTFVAILQAWLMCIAVYYVWQVVLRWLKAIE